ncbi:hypothetical protein PC116_g25668 [Phytophthora cactorum]|nr:hypothetical protein Pcac1_g23018 [Phytophthora cactorum]KAG2970684.1 hypothetical protein PC119_g23588 [Phytophthora cactorum]KAG4225913.1 hypothetical protein PC116_g25668 [Phytophthora cactorum]
MSYNDGGTTNNQAECRGLLTGLIYAQRKGIRRR